MDLCLAADQKPCPQVSKRWWEQDGADLEGMRTADWGAECMEEGGGDGQGRDRDKLIQWEDNL